ncbi:hypothetical protein [Pampinifervens florentissimum]|uniref:hypothetical protein n=1 Tax=Pampinifervens florentissimum TaxID=1632019 RepID=UPI0013B47D74|nr:hypothetical protein [Hydrogenobacter sp. T-8]QID32313.1 hypothetical protein G3M65_00365 [Hydrogenobacter sp. T-8]
MESVAVLGLFRILSEDVLPVVVLIILLYHMWHINRAIDKIEKTITTLKEDVALLEKNKIDKDEHLQDVSGWRWEIQRLEDRMEKFFDRLTELIQMLKER